MCEFVNSAGLKCKSEKERHPVHHGFDFSGPTPVPWEEPNLDWVEKPPTPDDAAMKAKLKEMTRAVRQNRRELAKEKTSVPDDGLSFDGETYVEENDQKRLGQQHQRVWTLMLDGEYRTLSEISASTGDPEASVSARLRDFRKERFGGHTVLHRHRGDPKNGLFEYALNPRVPRSPQPPPQPVMRNFD